MIPFQSQIITGAVCLVVGFGAGWKVRDALADAKEAKVALAASQALARATADTLRRTEASNAVTEVIGAKSAARQVQIRTVTQEIIREVPTYVTVQADARCDVSTGFVRHHDRAASGAPASLPDPAGPSNDAPSGVALSTVSRTLAENYGQCIADSGRLLDLQEWIRAQAAEWAKTDP